MGGGCDICAVNLYRFWCHVGCSPKQSEFSQVHGHKFIPDPQNISKQVEVLYVTINVDPDTVCDFFQSCKKTSFASQVSSMQNAAGMISFIGANAVGQGQIYYDFNFTKDPKALSIPMARCEEKNYNFTDQYGHPICKNCSCNNCEGACQKNDSIHIEPFPFFTGFNWNYVIPLYSFLVVLSVGIKLCQIFGSKKAT